MGAYVPMSELIHDRVEISNWPSIDLGISHPDIITKGILIWCSQEACDLWTISGPGNLKFKLGEDALMCSMKFGGKS